MKTHRLALAGAVAITLTVGAQPLQPKPAFPGQTAAPAPAKPSAPVTVETIAGGLTGAWAVAFLPDGNFLVTQNAGTLRIVRPDGVVLGPIAGVPDVKSVAAQGLHDVLLDPEFAKNRLLYFTYFAPPRGKRRLPGRSSSSTSASGPGRSPSGGRCSWVRSESRGRG